MAELAAMFERAGCEAVRTYIQSGNVIFSATAPVARSVPVAVARAIAARFGFETTVVTRTAAEMAAAVGRHPFARPGTDPKFLHVGFLDRRPAASRVAALDPDRSPPDRFAVSGREVFLHLPNGAGRTKLTTPYLDATLAATVTIRNWNTVLALAGLARPQ